MIRKRRIGLAAVVVALVSSGIGAAVARTDSAPRSVYRLDQGSAYTSGCFGPCDCPAISAAMSGTFLMTPVGADPLFTTYLVTDVNFRVAFGDPELSITGSGTYRVGGDFAPQQQLSLDLVIGGQPVAHFDSGLAPAGAVFPGINVVVSMNGMACFDTVLTVVAAPVPSRQIRSPGKADDGR